MCGLETFSLNMEVAFLFFDYTFAVTEIFQSHSFILLFLPVLYVSYPKLRSLMVPGFTFMSLVCIMLIYAYCMSTVLLFCMWISNFLSTFIEDIVLSTLCILSVHVKDQLTLCAQVSILALYLLHWFLCLYSCQNYTMLITIAFSLKSGSLIPTALIFLLKIALALQGLCTFI